MNAEQTRENVSTYIMFIKEGFCRYHCWFIFPWVDYCSTMEPCVTPVLTIGHLEFNPLV